MKRKYTKGEIKRVRLVPEEAVLLACKSSQMVGPYHTGVTCIGLPGEQCLNPGS